MTMVAKCSALVVIAFILRKIASAILKEVSWFGAASPAERPVNFICKHQNMKRFILESKKRAFFFFVV
tara:strand:- start:21 stop:224 length:204 start_codon:yes stop_codon:yes gene_type:complete